MEKKNIFLGPLFRTPPPPPAPHPIFFFELCVSTKTSLTVRTDKFKIVEIISEFDQTRQKSPNTETNRPYSNSQRY